MLGVLYTRFATPVFLAVFHWFWAPGFAPVVRFLVTRPAAPLRYARNPYGGQAQDETSWLMSGFGFGLVRVGGVGGMATEVEASR
jgi:hypothetical protein